MEPTKKRPIRLTFTGPVENQQKAIEALAELGFVETADTLPWREALPELTEEQLPGTSLKGARTKEGLTQKQLSAATGIKQHHISEMENHKRSIGKKNALKLAEVLNISYKVFL